MLCSKARGNHCVLYIRLYSCFIGSILALQPSQSNDPAGRERNFLPVGVINSPALSEMSQMRWTCDRFFPPKERVSVRRVLHEVLSCLTTWQPSCPFSNLCQTCRMDAIYCALNLVSNTCSTCGSSHPLLRLSSRVYRVKGLLVETGRANKPTGCPLASLGRKLEAEELQGCLKHGRVCNNWRF